MLSLSKPKLAFSSHQALIIVMSSMWNNKLFIQFIFPIFELTHVLCFKESLIIHSSHSCVLSHLIEVFFFFFFLYLYLSASFSLSCLHFMIEWTKTILSFDSLFGLTNVRFKDSFISKLAKRDHMIHILFEWPSLLKVKQHWFENSKEHDSTW